MSSEKLSDQAKNNSQERFAMGDFKDVFMDMVIEAQDSNNNIGDQILKDERILRMQQQMVAKMVWTGFQQGPRF